jgi:MFS family permease
VAIAAYREVLRLPAVRRVVLVSFLLRVPMWASNVIMTLHIVGHLHRSYAAAGVLTGVATAALAINGPWRGRRLDQVGLRRTLIPSLIALSACWAVAPFGGYWLLFILATVGGLFVVPSFSIVRQVLLHVVPEEHRRAALSVDSVLVEVSYMVGPALGVLLATYLPTSWSLFACEYASVLAAGVLWLANPPLRSDEPGAAPAGTVASGAGTEEGPGAQPRSWLSPAVIAVLLMASSVTVVLVGTDVAVVAALRHMGHQSWIGWELGLWGFGSALGGTVYGALHRDVPVAALGLLLGAVTLPLALAPNPAVLAVLLVVAGLLCAPTITATVDALSRLVPERIRGEALGWHGSAMTTGGALGAPLAGIAIDRTSWRGGFVLPALFGIATALAGLVALGGAKRRGARDDAAATHESVAR